MKSQKAVKTTKAVATKSRGDSLRQKRRAEALYARLDEYGIDSGLANLNDGRTFGEWLNKARWKDGQVNLPIEASLDHEEWLAIAKDARRLGITIEQLCGAIIAREAEAIVNKEPRA